MGWKVGFALVFAACSGDASDDTETGTEADTETGTEADTDVDTTPGTNTMAGSLTYRVVHDGYDADGNAIPDECETTFTITGNELVDACDDCEWAFTLEQGAATGDCDDIDETMLFTSAEPLAIARPVSDDDDVIVAPVDSLDDPDTWSYFDAEFSIEGRQFVVVQQRGVSTDVTEPRFVYSNACERPDVVRSDAPVSGTSVQGSLPCEAWRHDSYTFDVTGDEVVELSVDTIDPSSGFRPNIILNGPSGCASSLFAYAFDCSSGPEGARCPGGALTNPEPGTWELLVVDEGLCAADTVAYELTVSGTTLTPVDDDVRTYGSIDITRKRSVLDATFRFTPR